ncbi:50S ribosomal protein L13 [Candidatus Parcubacteria bacterium]|nr:50S ribosomal protein L13 [Candidatus Parcubacteria bacterium]
MNKETYTIDANGKAIGRVASEAALRLLGKTTPDFKRNEVKDLSVTIVNAGKIKIHPKKAKVKRYKTFSGYPDGLKERSMEQVIEKKGVKEVIYHAVRGMLPKNKLQDKRLRNLTITE